MLPIRLVVMIVFFLSLETSLEIRREISVSFFAMVAQKDTENFTVIFTQALLKSVCFL